MLHTGVTRRALPGDIEGGAVVDRGAYDGEAEGDIDGRIEGEINTTGNLIIGKNAVVEADIKVGTISVSGKVVGSIHAKGNITLHQSAKVYGNLFTPALTMEEGVFFQGNCQMEENVKKIPLLEIPERSMLSD